MVFNKEKFAELLRAAKGNRSINRYGNDSGVDPGYISRLLRCLIETPPSANIINKLAEKAHNGISVVSLMQAAGYLENNDSTIIDKAHANNKIKIFFGDYLSAPRNQQEELRKIWEIIRERDSGKYESDK